MKLYLNHPKWALVLVFLPLFANAKVVYWPDVCPEATVSIENKTNTNKSIWLQKFNSDLIDETEYTLTAKQTVEIEIKKTEPIERYSILHFYESTNLNIKYNCKDLSYPSTELDGGDLTFKNSKGRHQKVWLQNIYSSINDVQIEFLNQSKQVIKTKKFQLESQKSLSLTEDTISWSFVKISSSQKLVSYLLEEDGAKLPIEIAPHQLEPPADVTYFLAAPRQNNDDSFIVKISNAALIEKARNYILHPESEKIVFATIQRNHQNFNRNMNHPSKNHWSWSVTEVTSFGDFGSTACNGHPQELEDRVDKWVDGIGRICFWNYRLKRELKPEEVKMGKLNTRN